MKCVRISRNIYRNASGFYSDTYFRLKHFTTQEKGITALESDSKLLEYQHNFKQKIVYTILTPNMVCLSVHLYQDLINVERKQYDPEITAA